MGIAVKLLTGVALAMLLALAPNPPMSGGEALAQSKAKKGCECMKFCASGQGNKCVQCRARCG